MRTINRKIAGAFIFSSDGKVLLGHNKKGGTYQDLLVIPAGGIKEHETPLEAVKREVFEETGLDISHASIKQFEIVATGESEKTLKDTNEVVYVKMQFYDFEVRMQKDAKSLTLTFEDDFGDAKWYTPEELKNLSIGPNPQTVLQKLHFL
jgi:8-oxo-dGTP pyrophosphatase MutT (NUDIX family)